MTQMTNSTLKKYLLTIIVQILVITIYTVCNFFGLKVEAIALNPLIYIIPFGVLMLAIDILCIVLIFKNKKAEPKTPAYFNTSGGVQ